MTPGVSFAASSTLLSSAVCPLISLHPSASKAPMVGFCTRWRPADTVDTAQSIGVTAASLPSRSAAAPIPVKIPSVESDPFGLLAHAASLQAMSSKFCPFGNECIRQHWDGQSFPLRVYTRVLVWDHPLVGKLHWHHLFQLWFFLPAAKLWKKSVFSPLDEVGAAVGPSAYKGYWYARTIALAFAFFPPSYLSSNCQDNMFIRYFVPCQLETLGCYEVSNLHVLSLVAATFTDFQTSTYLRCSWLHAYTSGFAKNLFTPLRDVGLGAVLWKFHCRIWKLGASPSPPRPVTHLVLRVVSDHILNRNLSQ